MTLPINEEETIPAGKPITEEIMKAIRARHLADMGLGENPKPVPFVCRICQHTAYTEERQSDGMIGPGGQSWVTGYQCAGCSIRFTDPEKFSAHT